MRRIALILALIAAPIAVLATSAGADDTHTYEIEMYNAFGLVPGSDVRIAGVNAGEVTDLDVDAAKRAIVTVDLSGDLGVLGKDTRCSSEPQSLIAEYFISCDPSGPPIQEDDDADNPDPDIPASHVEQTVQTDLVQNTLREPFRQRFALIINEFGTALAGNPDSLNQAIRLGAPALTQLRKVTQILASQNTIIRDLNANSDQVIGKLADRRQDVVRFIQKARDTAEASTARRADLSQDFNLLDDFLAQLRPTLASIDNLAVKQTPLLRDLRAAAPQLTRLSVNLPPFNSATEASLKSLGGASQVGEKALRRGSDEIHQLAQSGAKAPETAEILADFLSDIDDPRRAVEIDDRVTTDTGRTNPNPGTKNEKGYTGLEGLLNYAYYQAGAINQFDQIGHLLHFSLYNVFTGPCGNFVSGHDPQTGTPGVPAEGGGTTTNILKADNCVSWLGPNQPGINEDLGLPKYDPSVCPKGTEPQAAADALCSPGGGASGPARTGGRSTRAGRGQGAGSQEPTAQQPSGGSGGDQGGGSGGSSGPIPNDILDQILDLPPRALHNLPGNLQDQLGGLGGLGQQPQSGGGGSGAGGSGDTGSSSGGSATDDLLDFLFSS
jgi:ABC-type transporter Mla subunit MlaD